MLAPDLAVLAVPVASLTLLPGNPRRGDVDAIVRSLARFGQRKPIVAKRDGTVVAGNHTLQAVQQLGWDEIAVVWVDDDEATAQAFALADNRTAELGGYDEAALLELIEQVRGVDPELLADTGWLPDAVAALEASLAEGAPPEALTDPDDVPEPPAEPVTKPGDLWLLGPHRVLCGDATKRVDVRRLLDGCRPDLMVTDPPYGVLFGSAKKNAISGDLTQAVIPIAFAVALEVLSNDARLYLFGGSGNWGMYAGLFDHHLQMEPRAVVWVKDSFVLRHNGYHSQFELVYFGWKGKGGSLDHWYGNRKQSDVWHVSRSPAAEKLHPTQKPVEACAIPIRNSCPSDGSVFEPFGGSGATLIAAHGLGRTCYALELDAQYVDVICRRYQEHTGTKPILEATGEPHDFTRETEHAQPAEAG